MQLGWGESHLFANSDTNESTSGILGISDHGVLRLIYLTLRETPYPSVLSDLINALA